MNYRYEPIYLQYPILQTSFVIFWIPIGFIISKILYFIIETLVFNLLSFILGIIFPISFEMFIISERMDVLVQHFYLIIILFFDFIILIIGLELINYFITIKRKELNFNE